ncbi:hypothetical protein PENTCL1PPCAC_975, partial [Pristionchus entomophagus]
MRLSNIIQLCYGIPGVLAYFLVIQAMNGVRRVLNRSFIIIFIVTAGINIATWLNAWISLRLQSEPFFFLLLRMAYRPSHYRKHYRYTNISILLCAKCMRSDADNGPICSNYVCDEKHR